MEKDSNKYNLEEFLRSHLEDYEVAENGWNMPPDELWEEVKPQLKAKESQPIYKTFGKYLPLLAVVLFSIGIIFYQFSKNEDEIFRLNSELQSIKKDLSDIRHYKQQPNAQGDSGSIKNNTVQGATKLDQKTPGLKPMSSTTAPLPGVQKTDLFTQTEEVQTPASSAQSLKTAPQSENAVAGQMMEQKALDSLSKSVADEEKTLDPKDGSFISELRLLSTLPIPNLEYKDATLSIEPLLEAKKHIKGPPSFKFSLGPMQVDRFLDTIPEKFEEYLEHRYRGISLGLNLEWPLSYRWFVETGVNYFHYSANTEHNKHLHYSESNANPPGLGPNDFLINSRLHSAVGHAQTQLIFTRENASSSIPRRMNVSIKSKTHAHYIGIPLLLGYRIHFGRLSAYLRGGLIGSTRIHQKFHVNHATVKHSNVEFKHSDATNDIEDVKQFHLQYMIGAGLGYRFSPYYTIHIEPEFSRSLSPLTTIENVNIGLQSMGIRGGFKIHF